MRYSVRNMDHALSTTSVTARVSGNPLQIPNGVNVSHGASGNSSVSDEATKPADGRTRRKSSWKNTPGIRVSLQSKEQQPQLEEYRQLRSDGRRKDSTKVAESENIKQTIEAESLEKRSVTPRAKIILDSFIQQMGGGEQSLSMPTSSGSYINTSV